MTRHVEKTDYELESSVDSGIPAAFETKQAAKRGGGSGKSVREKRKQTTPAGPLTEEEKLTHWRTVLLAGDAKENISKLLAQGFDLLFAFRALIHQQLAILPPEHVQRIAEALLAHAGMDHLVEAVVTSQVKLVRLLANHFKKNDRLDQLISTGIYVGATVLAVAAELGFLNIMRELMAAGANVNISSTIRGHAYLPLQLIVEKGYWEIFDDLCKAGADPHSVWQGMNAMYIAARAGHFRLIQSLIAIGVDANHACLDAAADDELGCTPVFIAAANGHGRIVKQLILPKSVAGAAAPYTISLATGPYRGQTPLQIAVARGHKNVVRVLLAAEIKIDAYFTAVLSAAKALPDPTIYKALERLASSVDSSSLPLIRENIRKELGQIQEQDFAQALANDSKHKQSRRRGDRSEGDDEDEYQKPSIRKITRWVGKILALHREEVRGKKRSCLFENLFGYKKAPELSLPTVIQLHELFDDLMITPEECRLERIIKYIANPDVLHYLCAQGWDLHARDKFGHDSAIICATEIDMYDRGDLYKPFYPDYPPRVTPLIVRHLLTRGANPDDRNPVPTSMLYNYSIANPLQMVIRSKHCEVLISTLMDAGADPDVLGYWQGPTNIDFLISGYTLLHLSAKLCKPSAFILLLKYAVNIYARNDRYRPSLPTEVTQEPYYGEAEEYVYHKKEAIQQMRDAWIQRAHDHWRHILLIEDKKQAPEAVSWLIRRGAHPNTIMAPSIAVTDPARIETPAKTALYWLVMHHPAGLAVLPSDLEDDSYNALLYQLAQHGQQLLLLQLLDLMHQQGKSSLVMNVLYFAAYYGHAPIVEALLQRGVSYDHAVLQAGQRWTPLCAAAYFGHLAVAKALLDYAKRSRKEADLIHTSASPLSLAVHPLVLAAAGGHLAIVQLLLSIASIIDLRVDEGPTALACAVKRAVEYPSLDALKIVQLLLSHHADPHLSCKMQLDYMPPRAIETDLHYDFALRTEPKDMKPTGKAIKITDLVHHKAFPLRDDRYLLRPAWLASKASVSQFYSQLTDCLRSPAEYRLSVLMNDLGNYDLIIQLLNEQVCFPPDFVFVAPQGPLVETALTPSSYLRELFGLLASHYHSSPQPPFNIIYYNQLVLLRDLFPLSTGQSPRLLSGSESRQLDTLIKNLYALHIELLSTPAERSRQAAGRSSSLARSSSSSLDEEAKSSGIAGSSMSLFPFPLPSTSEAASTTSLSQSSTRDSTFS